MSRLTQWLTERTGYDLNRGQPHKYLAVDLYKRTTSDFSETKFNYCVQFKTKAEFKKWLKDNVAKVDQRYWVLYTQECAS